MMTQQPPELTDLPVLTGNLSADLHTMADFFAANPVLAPDFIEFGRHDYKDDPDGPALVAAASERWGVRLHNEPAANHSWATAEIRCPLVDYGKVVRVRVVVHAASQP